MGQFQHNASDGLSYLLLGFKLIRLKGIRHFVFIPLFVNCILFYFAFSYIYDQLDIYMAQLEAWLPDMIKWLMTIVWPLVIGAVLVLFSFIFTSVANWLAAPFNGLLSEKVEAVLTGETPPDGGILDIVKDIPRTLAREWTKLVYYIPRALGFLIIFFILPFFGQVIWFLFVAWMMAIQYKDYPFDNHKVPFSEMKRILNQHKGLSFSFGISVSLFTLIPFINLVIMPVAICSATAIWVDKYKHLTRAY